MKAATIIFSPNGGISLIESFALVCMFAHTNLITYESLYSSSYLLNEYLLYDKLWGPSQRVVILFQGWRTYHQYGSVFVGICQISA